MSGMGARSACFRFPQLMQTKTRRDMPNSMSISRSSNMDPLHFSQVCMKLVPMIHPSTAGSSLITECDVRIGVLLFVMDWAHVDIGHYGEK